MPTLARIQELSLQVLQDYPAYAARYAAGDPTITAPLQVIQHVLAEFGRDVDISELEPFMKTREATILADASNKGILPLCTPCQHYIEVINNGNNNLSLASGRVILDGQGRPWRLLQSVNAAKGEMVAVLAEQSELREVTYSPTVTEPFHFYPLELQSDVDLVQLSVTDQDGNIYSFAKRWMNTNTNDKAIVLTTNTRRKMTMQFGDSTRFGTTLQAGTVLTIQIIESFGDIDAALLREASLETVETATEQRAVIRFKTGGLFRTGADSLNTEQLRLLASYPDFDDAVFLGNYNASCLKSFLPRSHYLNVWNEVEQEANYGPSYASINKMFVAVAAKTPAEQSLLQEDVANYIGLVNNLYKGKVVFHAVEERAFNLSIQGLLSPVHNAEAVKEQIKTLLLKFYGRETTATSYYIADGFNSQEIGKLLSDNISAFQDRTSDFKMMMEDLEDNPIKPHQWTYLTADSISLDIKQTKNTGGSRWSII